MSYLELTAAAKQQIADIALISGYLWERGWAVKNGGNISLEITGEINLRSSDLNPLTYTPLKHPCPDLSQMYFIMTGAGTRMRDVACQPLSHVCVIRISDDGTGYYHIRDEVFNSPAVPTSEMPTHLAIHQFMKKQGGKNRAVLHTHPIELTALTLIPGFCDESRLNKILMSVQPEAVIAIPGGVGLVPFILPGTDQLAEKTVASLRYYPVVLWEKHGCIAIGHKLQDAFDLIDVLNTSAKLFFLCREAGYTPQGLSAQEIENLKKYY
ncbi:MAG: rhamnulose-1-phosphate aldolase [Ignavibacteriae bacterium]|nr:MAG: rhamnulose-1-phosphate aldolase [Ignavibacteriota bacterium]